MTSSDLLSRAVQEAVPMELARQKLTSGSALRVYLGIDPTGTKLHLGHAVVLRKLRAFADAGHDAIFLIGSFTGMIGDPTGRDKMRQSLTREQVEENFERYKEQASKVLDFSRIQIRYNHEWLEKLQSAQMLEIMSHFTVQQLMHRDMFRERMKKGEDLSSMELMYPLLQGYDSVMLDVDIEIGGNDQLFNMLCGRTLQKEYGKRDKCVLTTKLIEGTDGRKMSKTYDNCIWLDDSADDMYGKAMSIRDDLIVLYMECCTDIPLSEIEEVQRSIQSGENPMQFKKRLAEEIVRIYYDNETATKAADRFTDIFSHRDVPEDMPHISLVSGETWPDLLIRIGACTSKSDARRLIDQGAVQLDGEKITLESAMKPGVLKAGKRTFVQLQDADASA